LDWLQGPLIVMGMKSKKHNSKSNEVFDWLASEVRVMRRKIDSLEEKSLSQNPSFYNPIMSPAMMPWPWCSPLAESCSTPDVEALLSGLRTTTAVDKIEISLFDALYAEGCPGFGPTSQWDQVEKTEQIVNVDDGARGSAEKLEQRFFACTGVAKGGRYIVQSLKEVCHVFASWGVLSLVPCASATSSTTCSEEDASVCRLLDPLIPPSASFPTGPKHRHWLWFLICVWLAVTIAIAWMLFGPSPPLTAEKPPTTQKAALSHQLEPAVDPLTVHDTEYVYESTGKFLTQVIEQYESMVNKQIGQTTTEAQLDALKEEAIKLRRDIKTRISSTGLEENRDHVRMLFQASDRRLAASFARRLDELGMSKENEDDARDEDSHIAAASPTAAAGELDVEGHSGSGESDLEHDDGSLLEEETYNSQFEPGAFVQVIELKAKPHLNQMVGILESYHADRGRWAVSLDDYHDTVLVRRENLRLLSSDEIDEYFDSG